MWRIWNSVAKGFRSTAVRGYRENVAGDREPNSFLPLRQNPRPLQNESTSQQEQHSTQGLKDDFTSSTRPLKDYTLAETVGLGTVLAAGWHLCHHRRKKGCYSENTGSTLLEAVLRIAFAQPESNAVKLHVADRTQSRQITSAIPPPTTCEEINFNKDIPAGNVQHRSQPTLPKLLEDAMQDLFHGENLYLGDLQNQAGVQLLVAAKQGGKTGDPELDQYLCLESASACQQEAFLCFREASQLGSTKGKFNLGLCYEQGVGAPVDLAKAVRYYEEAAKEGHSAAQYNLGLLYFHGQVPGRRADKERAVQLWRQAARGGLEQAWSALLTLLHNDPASSQWNGSTSSLKLLDDISSGLDVREASGSFQMRKSQSEPRNLCMQS